MSTICFIIAAIILGIDSFAASAIGRVRLLSLGVFFIALGLALGGLGYASLR